MKIYKFHFFLFFNLVFLSIKAQQNDINFDHITINEGLSQSVINCILKDSRGFMWFGTQDGLNRYDGYNFKIYKHNRDNINSISNNNINCLAEDAEGNIWIGTNGGGLNKLIRKKDIFEKIKLNSDSATTLTETILSLLIDEKNNIWIGTHLKGLIRLNGKDFSKTIYQYNENEKNSLCGNSINTIFEDKEKNLWIGTVKGLNKFLLNENRFIQYQKDETKPGSISNNNIMSIIEDQQNNLWIGTWGGGLNKMNPKTQEFTSWPTNEEPNSINSIYINTVIIDHKGRIWIGSWDGLYCYHLNQNKIYSWQKDDLNPNSLSNNNINIVYEDNTSIMWIGYWGSGVDKFYNKQPKFMHYKNVPRNKNSLSNNTVWSIFEDHEEVLWIGTDYGLNCYNRKTKEFTNFLYNETNPNSLSENYVYSIYEDKENNLWIGTWSGGLNKYNRKTGNFTRFFPIDDNPNSISSNIINTIKGDQDGNIWIGTAKGINKYNTNKQKFESLDFINNNNIKTVGILSVFFDSENNLWLGSDGQGLYKIDFSTNHVLHYKNKANQNYSISNNVIFSIYEDSKNNIWVGTEAGLNILNQKTNEFALINEKNGLPNDVIYGILANRKNEIWVSTNNGLSQLFFDDKDLSGLQITNYDISDNLQSKEFNLGAYFQSKTGEMFFGGINGFNSFFPDSIKKTQTLPEIVITDFKIFNRTVAVGQNADTDFNLKNTIEETTEIHLSHKHKMLSFEFAAMHFVNPTKNKYAYMLKGFEKDWKFTQSSRRFVTYTNLDPGKYELLVKASNNDGVWQNPVSLKLTIAPPFWKTNWFYTLVVVFIIILIRVYIKIRERNLKLINISLERKVKSRTKEILRQKKEITDSIIYSKHIQSAILPDKKTINQIIPNSFIYYLPREIIGGDFYWLMQKGGKQFVAVADCTGHGVPGALMSMLGITFLSEIVSTLELTDPAEILNLLRDKIIGSLHQTPDEESSRDGMDISICVIDKEKGKLHFAGANHPITICNNGVLKDYLPDKMPIRHHHMIDKSFHKKSIDLSRNDIIYMYSDGYADQFGGDDGRKLLKSNFRKILAKASRLTLNEQLPFISKSFNDWKREQEQIDDVLVLGFKVF